MLLSFLHAFFLFFTQASAHSSHLPFISDLFSFLQSSETSFSTCFFFFVFSSSLFSFSYIISNSSSFHTCLKYLPSFHAPFVNPRLLVTRPFCFCLLFISSFPLIDPASSISCLLVIFSPSFLQPSF